MIYTGVYLAIKNMNIPTCFCNKNKALARVKKKEENVELWICQDCMASTKIPLAKCEICSKASNVFPLWLCGLHTSLKDTY